MYMIYMYYWIRVEPTLDRARLSTQWHNVWFVYPSGVML